MLRLPGYSTEKIGFVIGLNTDGTVATVAPRGEAEATKENHPDDAWCLSLPRSR